MKQQTCNEYNGRTEYDVRNQKKTPGSRGSVLYWVFGMLTSALSLHNSAFYIIYYSYSWLYSTSQSFKRAHVPPVRPPLGLHHGERALHGHQQHGQQRRDGDGDDGGRGVHLVEHLHQVTLLLLVVAVQVAF
jgi:hypothetical protein